MLSPHSCDIWAMWHHKLYSSCCYSLRFCRCVFISKMIIYHVLMRQSSTRVFTSHLAHFEISGFLILVVGKSIIANEHWIMFINLFARVEVHNIFFLQKFKNIFIIQQQQNAQWNHEKVFAKPKRSFVINHRRGYCQEVFILSQDVTLRRARVITGIQ